MGVSVAATALIARSWGAQQVKQAEVVSWASLVISVALAAVLSIPVLTMPDALAGLFGLDAETTALAYITPLPLVALRRAFSSTLAGGF